MSRLPRLIRLMHTGGRQIPHPNQGGAGTASSISPSTGSNIPPKASPTNPLPEPAPGPLAAGLDQKLTTPDAGAAERDADRLPPKIIPPRREFTPAGKLIVRRPRRTIPVTLPSGHPEPSTYPPPPEYFENIKSLREIRIHPLWQFFHIPAGSGSTLDKKSPNPPVLGFGSITGLDTSPADLIRSGMSHLPNTNSCLTIHAGRAWKTEELQKKSFADLHILWYVLLKERNVLATQAAELRRLTIQTNDSLIPERKRRVNGIPLRICQRK